MVKDKPFPALEVLIVEVVEGNGCVMDENFRDVERYCEAPPLHFVFSAKFYSFGRNQAWALFHALSRVLAFFWNRPRLESAKRLRTLRLPAKFHKERRKIIEAIKRNDKMMLVDEYSTSTAPDLLKWPTEIRYRHREEWRDSTLQPRMDYHPRGWDDEGGADTKDLEGQIHYAFYNSPDRLRTLESVTLVVDGASHGLFEGRTHTDISKMLLQRNVGTRDSFPVP